MASANITSFYLPALDDLLHRKQAVVSWHSIYLALADPVETAQAPALEKILQDEKIRGLLIDPFLASQTPSKESRTQFDSFTSAVNVPATESSKFDVKQLKDDALWLSKEVEVDEVIALRVVLLEWQDRPKRDLVAKWSEEEILSLRNVTATSNSGTLSKLVGQAEVSPTGRSGETGNDGETRKRDILTLFYNEQQHIWKASEAVIGVAQAPEYQLSQRGFKGPSRSQGLRLTAEAIWKAQMDKYPESNDAGLLVRLAKSLQDLFEQSLGQDLWPAIAQDDVQLARVLVSSTLERMISQLRIAQSLLFYNTKRTTSANDVGAWFGVLQECAFFSPVQGLSPEFAPQFDAMFCLVVFVTVELLRAGPTMESLYAQFDSSEPAAYPKLSHKPYIEDSACLRKVTTCLSSARENSILWTGPICLVWAILAQRLRALVVDLGIDIQQFADGRDDTPEPSSRRSSLKGANSAATSKLTPLLIAITEAGSRSADEDGDSIAALGNFAFRDANALDAINHMIHNLGEIFRLPSDVHTAICSKITALDMLRHAVTMAPYSVTLAESVVEILTYPTVSTVESSTLWPLEPASSLDADNEIMGALMAQIVARYPHDLGSFSTCLQAAGQSEAYVDEDGSKIALLLEDLGSFTTEIPLTWPYTSAEEPEKVILQKDLPIFTLKRGVPSTFTNNLMTIPAGTEGLILAERNNHAVIRWYYQHSGLEYIGALLSSRSEQSRVDAAVEPGDMDIQVEADTIALITTMLKGSLAAADENAPKLLLGRISDGMPRNDDIISVVFKSFEYHLQRHAVATGDESSIAMLVQCIEFMTITLQVYPERIWTQLARSSLLPIDDTSGTLVAVIGTTEIPMASFKFLSACVSLFAGLIDDCVKRAVLQRTSVNSKALTRFDDQYTVSQQTPQKMISTLLFGFSRLLLEVLQNQPSWRFADPKERHSISASIFKTNREILQLVHGIGAEQRDLFFALKPAASHITTIYLTDNHNDLSVVSVMETFMTALSELVSTSEPRLHHELTIAAAQALSFCTSTLKIGMTLGKSGSALRQQLFQALPLLARLFAVHDGLRPLVAELLEALVRSANQAAQEPPSLLGHLSTESTKRFLSVLSDIDTPLQSLDAEAIVWDMLSAIVSNKQQWLAISLLTGSTPRERLKAIKNTDPSTKSLIDAALDSLTRLASLPPRRAVALLSFVSHAQDHWEWVSTTISRHGDFISSNTDWLSKLTSNVRPNDTEACIRTANENQMASFVVNILARYVHNTKDSDRGAIAKQLYPKLGHLRDHASQIDGYNHSLHMNLIKNFDQKFAGVSLESFKRSDPNHTNLGENYYYDLDLAERVLSFDPSWRRRKGQGFIDEVARANVNHSLVDSQIALLKSWKSLGLELLSVAGHDTQLQKDMTTVASGCLRANIDGTIPVQLFGNIAEIRADFAFIILQHLNRAKSQEPEVKNLFALAWEAIRATGLDFEVITDPSAASYYRTLLQILFLSIYPHAEDATQGGQKASKQSLSKSASTKPLQLTPVTASFLEVLNKVIATNFRALCTLVHSSTPSAPSLAQPSDFVLLSALLQSLLRIPTLQVIDRQIASAVADTSLIRYATSLYSWSESLTPSDPGIYGEIAIGFLLSLSTIPQIAEQIATESVLTSLSSASISAHLRGGPASSTNGEVSGGGGGCGPFDHPPRLHAIWTRGVLPLLLNLVSAVGPGIAPEIAAFLNSFPAQLRRCEDDMAAPLQPTAQNPRRGLITLALVAEAHSLSLLASVIEALRRQGAAIGVDAGEIQEVRFDRKGTAEVAAALLRDRRGLGERVVPCVPGEREMALRRRRRRAAREGAVVAAGDQDALDEAVVRELQGIVDAAAAI